MTVNNLIIDGLKHIRSTHLSLFLISFALLYLVFSAWTDAPETLEELKSFETTAAMLRTSDIRIIIPEKTKSLLQDEATKLIETEIGYNIRDDGNLKNIILSKLVSLTHHNNINNPLLDPRHSTLQQCRDAIEKKEWEIRKISNVVINTEDKKHFKNWIGEHKNYKYDWKGSIGGIGPYILDIQITSFNEGNSQGNMNLVFGVKKYLLSSRDTKRMTENPPIEIGMVEKNISMRFNMKTENIPIHKEWFQSQGYNRLNIRWNDLKNRTSTESIALLEREKSDRLEGRKQNIFGISISGPDIGYVGPFSIFIIEVYLLVFVSKLRRYAANNTLSEGEIYQYTFLPWVGVMSGFIPRLITVTTIAIVPTISVSMAIWRVLGLKTPSVLASLIILFIGIYCIYLGWQTTGLVGSSKRVGDNKDKQNGT